MCLVAAIKRYGFSKSLRLQGQQDFQAVFSQPIQSRSTYFTVLARPNGKDVPRLGLVIAKRYVRRSVDRSRLKRLIRESFRAHQQDLAGLDVVVLRRSGERSQETKLKLPDILERQWLEVLTRWKNG